jgi:hypothetical protein
MRLAPTTIAGRLLLSAVLFVTAALVVAGAVLAFILHQVVSDQVDQRLQAQGGVPGCGTVHRRRRPDVDCARSRRTAL